MADRSRSTGPGKYIAIAVALFCGALLFVAGIVFGVWFALNFRIVPKGDLEDMIAKALGEGASLDKVLPGGQDTGSVDVQKLLAEVQKAATEANGASDWTLSKASAQKPRNSPSSKPSSMKTAVTVLSSSARTVVSGRYGLATDEPAETVQ